ncbi:hypothetical protein N7492_001933 [Penicillium capsulatum]|uniref:Uncharacterized protein n=1 Tax=Penicillium capsulatum TaxID=69766 RepID=A0A9W9IGM8_9EURO|nr:hypothetical protein N7492_001933 [Penicillium capsulatum]KAJ6123444.1 hypothetical protein N7512_005909 [Penicillium capsulatum]
MQYATVLFAALAAGAHAATPVQPSGTSTPASSSQSPPTSYPTVVSMVKGTEYPECLIHVKVPGCDDNSAHIGDYDEKTKRCIRDRDDNQDENSRATVCKGHVVEWFHKNGTVKIYPSVNSDHVEWSTDLGFHPGAWSASKDGKWCGNEMGDKCPSDN